MLKRIFYDTYLRAEEEAQQYKLSPEADKIDTRVMVICVTVSLVLSLIYYFGNAKFFGSFLQGIGFNEWSARFRHLVTESGNAQLHKLTFWVSVIVICYFAVPFAIIKLWFREKLSDYGLSPHAALKDYQVYTLMLVVMIPLVLYFSGTSSFKARYPFYSLAPGESLWPNFWIWELLYFVQFFAVEFFFRGFMLHGLKKRFGFYSVFAMTIPYCMIHFGKPMPETISAIIAGIVLGVLSLKSRSIWLGVAIHYSVAITMDLAALWRKGLLFD